MARKLEADALTTLERVKRHLEVPESETKGDERLEEEINAASAWIRRYVGGQPIRQRAVSWSTAAEGLLCGDGTPDLRLPYRPLLAVSSIQVDARTSGLDWTWSDTTGEGGAMTYGPTHDWVHNPRTGVLTLLNGLTWPEGPFCRVDAVVGLADGTTAFPLPLVATYPFGVSIFGGVPADNPPPGTAPYGGRFHQLFGWDGGAGEAVQQKAAELVAWMHRQGERAQQGVASRSGDGFTVSYLSDVPREILSYFDSWRTPL